MTNFYFSLAIFILIDVFYLITVVFRKKKLEKFMSSSEITYLKKRYKLTMKNINRKRLACLIGFTNSLIISIVFFITCYINNYVLKLLVAFLVFVPSIILSYHIIGLILRKKEKNV